jgi:hypothetical protein
MRRFTLWLILFLTARVSAVGARLKTHASSCRIALTDTRHGVLKVQITHAVVCVLKTLHRAFFGSFFRSMERKSYENAKVAFR